MATGEQPEGRVRKFLTIIYREIQVGNDQRPDLRNTSLISRQDRNEKEQRCVHHRLLLVE
jgi:hypothetical protein